MYEQELEILQGTIAAIVYQNYDNGYSVLRLSLENGQTATVVGTIPLPCMGERLVVTGKWTSHSSYGRQFEAEFLERMMPQSANEILTYLSGRVIKGIGPRIAAKIVNRFGDETLLIMEREPERLAEISGITDKRAQEIGEEFRLQVGMRSLLEFFALHHLSAELAVKTYKLFGETAMDMLYDDPYFLTEAGLEAPFGAVDRFAIDIGISGEDPRRVKAGLTFELRYNLTAGHSFLPEEKLINATSTLLSVEITVVQKALDRLVETQQLIRTVLAGITVVYLPALQEAEVYCAARLQEFADCHYPKSAFFSRMVKTASQDGGFTYSPEQAQAIESAATTGLLLVTGGPGTGKTTIVKGILSLYDQMGLNYVLAAPTGRAAKRLTEVTGQEASTIHRLLDAGIDPHTGELFFSKNEEDPLKADAVIVDEMSMVDILLLHSLLKAIPQRTRLILVGDPDQLPPVGPGFPFNDMLRAKNLPAVCLTEIFRQAQESLIVMNAHSVNTGAMPELRNRKSDFFFLPCRTEEEVAQTIQGLCQTRLPKNMGIPASDIQVLSPTKKGGAGTVALNKILQAALNPASAEKKEKAMGEILFREGDRVMQIRNNYDILWKKVDGTQVGAGIFNGDVGIIRAIDTNLEQVSILFDDKIADYDFTQLIELEPAYAMTIHKSQGSGATRSLVKS